MIGRAPLAMLSAVLTTWCLSGPARAATYDPELTWRTIVTEHFRINFHQGEEQLADELSQSCEQIYATMSAELDHKLQMKVEVVLVDRTDRANGFATAIPYNTITIYVTAPQEDETLSLYEDWSEAILTHELTHVLHMETHDGVVSAARAVVGRIASTNAVSPLWVTEGLATFQETRHTAGGRGRSPYVDMLLRTAALEDHWPWLGSMDGFQARVPSGNLRYLFGQDFMRYVSDHTGEDVWTRWTHDYGRTIPFFLPAPEVFGRKLQGLWREWKGARIQKYQTVADTVRAEGLREGKLLSDPKASCTAPSFAPDDSWLVWSCSDPRTGNAIWRSETDGSGPKVLVKDYGAKNFTWRRDSQTFVFAATHIVNRFNTWSDIFMYDLRADSIKALTNGARARDPEFSPDGSRLLVVTNRAQDTRLEVMTIDQQREVLTHETNHTQYATPRYAPSGKAFAVSVWDEGRRDLWLMDASGARKRRLTEDNRNDRDPAWSADGQWLFFSSDRTGIPNVYAVEIATEHLWQVTNVLTGAAHPDLAPDGKHLAYQQYSNDGWEVRLMDLDPSTFLDRGPLPEPITGAPSLASIVDGPLVPVNTVVASAWDGPKVRKSIDGGPGPSMAAMDVGGPSSAGPRVAEAGTGGSSDRAAGEGAAVGEPRQDSERIDTFSQAKVKDAFGSEEDYPFHIKPTRYNPARTLVPWYWVPSFSTTPRLSNPPSDGPFAFLQKWPAPFNIPGVQVTASTSARDPLVRYIWGAFLDYRTDANFVGGGGSVTINRWLPVFGFGASTRANPYTYLVAAADQPVDENGDPTFTSDDLRTIFMREVNAYGTFQWPFTQVSTFYGTYSFTDRRLHGDLENGAYMPSVALRGTIGNLTAGYRYEWNEPTAYAISPEDGRTFVASATITAPWLGTFAVDEGSNTKTPVTQVLLQVDWREYVVNPLAPNHVFVFRAGTGVAFGGSERFLGNYQLGGNGVGGFRAIRGYPTGADRGDTYWAAGAEYRLPLWRIDRGFGTFPAFLRALSGSVFLEAGNAFDKVSTFTDVFKGTLAGAGAEIRLSTIIGWGGSLDLRLGYAAGLTPGGYLPTEPRSVYFLVSGGL